MNFFRLIDCQNARVYNDFYHYLRSQDMTRNIGLRMVMRIAKSVDYQNLLGLNVLTMRV